VVFLGDADSPEFQPRGNVVVWDPDNAAKVRLSLRESFHYLVPGATSSLAVVFMSEDNTFISDARTGSWVIPLDSGTPAYFDETSLDFGFTLVAPNYLYNTDDMKFYRPQPPLQRTPLPTG